MADTIYLDTRENNSKFIAYLVDRATEEGYDVKLEALVFGDIRYRNLVIERKQIDDFASSVTSDHMFNQIATMKANPDYNSIIILSGSYTELSEHNADKIPHMEGARRQIMAWGIPLIHCFNDEELVDKAFELFKYASEIETPVKRVDKDDKLALFLALPGVGRKLAKKIRKEYPSMIDLCMASKTDLMKLLKPSKGEAIYNALRG